MSPEYSWLYKLAIRASVAAYVTAAFVLTYGFGIGPTVETDMAFFATALLLLVSISHYAFLRFLVLPSVLTKSDRPADALVIADAFSAAPGIYGLVVSILTGHGLLALPFATIAAAMFYVLGSYVDEQLAQRAANNTDAPVVG